MKKFCLILVFCLFANLNANEDQRYEQLFQKLESEGIVVGRDISSEELFDFVNAPENQNSSMDDVFAKFKGLMEVRKEQQNDLDKQLAKNPNSLVNKEIKLYLDENKQAVEDTQKKIAGKNEDSMFSKVINSVLDMMK